MKKIEMIKTEILKRGFEVGCINRDLESLTKVALDKVKQNLDEEYTDVFVTIRGKLYVVEISTVDNEKDINVYKGSEYFTKYGNLDDCYDNGDITEEQYVSFGGNYNG